MFEKLNITDLLGVTDCKFVGMQQYQAPGTIFIVIFLKKLQQASVKNRLDFGCYYSICVKKCCRCVLLLARQCLHIVFCLSITFSNFFTQ